MDYAALIAKELNLQVWQVANTLALLAEGATIPFIARYRKERTGEMDETVLREVDHRFTYLKELDERRAAILKSIEEQEKLTPELRARIEACAQKTELEDIYLPYKPKRRTRATIAREAGLEPLARQLVERQSEGALTPEGFAHARDAALVREVHIREMVAANPGLSLSASPRIGANSGCQNGWPRSLTRWPP